MASAAGMPRLIAFLRRLTAPNKAVSEGGFGWD